MQLQSVNPNDSFVTQPIIISSTVMRCFLNSPRTTGTRAWQSSSCYHERRRSLNTWHCHGGRGHAFLRRWLVFHARRLQLISPFPTGSLVTMFEMLSEVIGSEEFLCLVAFTELVKVVQMLRTNIPLRRIWKFVPAIATDVGAIRRRQSVECCLYASKSCTRPGIAPKM